jgi:hypothetical protein
MDIEFEEIKGEEITVTSSQGNTVTYEIEFPTDEEIENNCPVQLNIFHSADEMVRGLHKIKIDGAKWLRDYMQNKTMNQLKNIIQVGNKTKL